MGNHKTSRLWNLNGTGSPECQDTKGVLRAYKKAIEGTKLAGPTYFSQVLGRVKTEIEANILNFGLENNNTYSVVIIITDGYCHDMEQTKSLLVDLSTMPFSGIVVGLGDSEFVDMEVLDADDMILSDSLGRTAARDVI